MTSRRSVFISLALALPAWGGLAYIIAYADPGVAANRFFFLTFLFFSLAFSLTPFFHFLEYRLANSRSRGDILRSARRSGLLALFFVLCAWMKMNQALNWTNAFLLVAALVLAEIFMVVRGA